MSPENVNNPVCSSVNELPATPPQLPPATWAGEMDIPVKVSVNVAPVRLDAFGLLIVKVIVEKPSAGMDAMENALTMVGGAA